jgi:stage II sporulation protein D
MRRALRILGVTLLFVGLGAAVVTARSKTIRVAILKETDHFSLAVEGPFSLFDFNTARKVDTGLRMPREVVSIDHGQLRIGNKTYANQRLIVQPYRDATLRVNSGQFRGMLVIINTGTRLIVVNSIDVEQYIRGVLYHEISDQWPMEAIMAQAVAARTYAFYAIDKFAANDFDVTNDVYSQVYGGSSSERGRTDAAVKQTRGEVLTWHQKIFPAFFHANSGGVTEDASELWDIDLPPLKGGVVSSYSKNAPHYKWTKNFRLKDIQDLLILKGFRLDAIRDIRVVERNRSGRVRRLEIEDRLGQVTALDGKAFRNILGPNVLRSNAYDIVMKGYYMDIVGRGWGHGVGMCQWGAFNMARLGFKYQQILSFYYPGSELQHYNDGE